IDVTRVVEAPAETIVAFLHEEPIAPDQIGAYKVRVHRAFLERWLQETGLGSRLTLERLWEIREECIRALAAS
ncbi:MAG: hypothetical protein ACREQ9_27195, partial [Candidatus Binatia bacterium]